ncbi:MAG: ABC transporter permease [Christensenellales bacterium]
MLAKRSLAQRACASIRRDKYVYIMAVPVVIYYLLFYYYPMYGAQIAFRNFSVARGITGSSWVGTRWFELFIKGPYFGRLMRNTLLISCYQLIFAFPAPILLALMLNELRSERYKRTIQSIVYLPHFISMVVMCGFIREFVGRYGIITDLVVAFGGKRTNLLNAPENFRTIYTLSGIWQSIGWNSIVYLSALTAVSPELHESATIDGANRFQRVIHITIPSIIPTIVTMFILQLGRVMSVGSEKILLLYNPNTYETADVISTYVYRVGLQESFQPSYSTAVGLFSSIINFALILAANTLSRKATDSSLW